MIPSPSRTPGWMTAIIILAALPMLAFPTLLSHSVATGPERTLLWIYPGYCLVASYLAWVSYPRRPALAWVLVALMIMSHVAVWLLP